MSQIQTIPELLGMIRRRWLVILAVAVLGSIAAVLYALTRPQFYEATAVIQIESPGIPQTAVAPADNTEASRRLQLIQQRLMSRDNLVRVIERHDLFTDQPGLSLAEQIFQLRISTRIEQIREGIEAWQPGGAPSGLRITVQNGDPQKAADLANGFVADVLEQHRARREEIARESVSFFEAEATRLVDQIAGLESQLAAFKRENADALPSNITPLRTQIARLEDTVLEIDRQIISLESSGARQRAGTVERQVQLLEDQKQLVGARLAELQGALASAPAVEQQFNALSRELMQLQDQYSAITQRRASAEMTEQLESRDTAERFEVLETALVPENAASGSRRKLALAGGLASVLAGFVVAFLLEMLNPAIRTAAQLERALGISPVVSIPHVVTRGDRQKRIALYGGLLIGGVIFALTAVQPILRAAVERIPQLRVLTGG